MSLIHDPPNICSAQGKAIMELAITEIKDFERCISSYENQIETICFPIQKKWICKTP